MQAPVVSAQAQDVAGFPDFHRLKLVQPMPAVRPVSPPQSETQVAPGGKPLSLVRGLRYDQLLDYVRRNPSLSVLEIGIARCETTIRLMAYAHQLGGAPRYVGVDLFESMTAALFDEAMLTENKRPRSYAATMDYLVEMLGPRLAERIMLLEGLSNRVLPTLRHHGMRFDLVFLDGGHSYEVAKGDWLEAAQLVADGGTIVIDDYPNWGLARMVEEIDRQEWNVRVLEKVDTFKNMQPDETNRSPQRQFQLVEVTRRR